MIPPSPGLRDLVDVTLTALEAGRRARGGPLPAGGPAVVRATTRAALGPLLAAEGIGASAALEGLVTALAAGSADPADPWCAAHLHCPPLAVAVAADLAVSALNPSLDSWDQAPAATTVEADVIAALATLVGFDPGLATGTITTGGTESNLMGLLLGRAAAGQGTTDQAATDRAATDRAATDQATTDQAEPDRPTGHGPPGVRVFCSAAAHFSVQRAASMLAIDAPPVVAVGVDDRHRMRVDELRRALADHDGPAIVVATAGTTDAGAIDPLREIAAALDAHRSHLRGQARSGQPQNESGTRRAPGTRPEGTTSSCWLHVDAAYGGGALLSDRLAGLLDGVARADSVSLDLHKLGWQPAPAGVFLTPHGGGWDDLETEVAYLNPRDDGAAGFTSLLSRSLRTTRRADAFPIAVTFRALGRSGLGARVDACHDLARHAARTVQADPRLDLALPVTLSTVVFRYQPPTGPVGPVGPAGSDRREPDLVDRLDQLDQLDQPDQLDQLNAELRRRLLIAGRAVVGRAQFGPGHPIQLKLTLVNPDATPADVDALLRLIGDTGDALAGRDIPRTDQATADPPIGGHP